MAYFTTQLCTKIVRPPLAWSPPIPIDIDSDLGVLVGAESFAEGSKYGLATDSLSKVLNRNYRPQELSWKLIGQIVAEVIIVGYQTTPGPFTSDPDEPIFDPPLIFPLVMNVEGTGNLALHEMPDFSQVERTVARLNFIQEFVIDGAYPIGVDEEGIRHGGYLVITMNVSIELKPYSWAHLGNYYLEHDIRITFTSSLHSGPGTLFSEYQFDEAVGGGTATGIFSIMDALASKRPAGSIAVRDQVTNDNWGTIDMFQTPDPLTITSFLQFQNLRHYLPITGF